MNESSRVGALVPPDLYDMGALVALGPDATIAQMAAWLRTRDAEEAAR